MSRPEIPTLPGSAKAVILHPKAPAQITRAFEELALSWASAFYRDGSISRLSLSCFALRRI